MKKLFVGIDFAKEKFDVTVVNTVSNETIYCGEFTNTRKGGQSMLRTVRKHSCGVSREEWLFCGEDTGWYSYVIANYLAENDYYLWLQNAYCIKRSEGTIRRGKDDKADSEAIATYARRFCEKAVRYVKPSENVSALKLLTTKRDLLVKTRVEIENGVSEIPKMDRQGDAMNTIKASYRSIIRKINDEIKKIEQKMDEITQERDSELATNYEILTSFKGVGRINATYMIVFTDNFRRYDFDARKICTLYGVAPFGRESGKTLNAKPRVSGMCNHQLKAVISSAAQAAVLWNGNIKQYYERLLQKGKCKGVAMNNVKNKIIHILIAMVREQRKWNPNFALT